MMTATTASVPAIVPTTMAATFGREGQSSAAIAVDVNTTDRSVTALANRAIILRRHDSAAATASLNVCRV